MNAQAGVVNLCMLLGLCLVLIKLFWTAAFAATTSIMEVLGKYSAWPLSLVYIFWGYSLASLTTVIVLQARQTAPWTSPGYEIIALLILAIFLASDQIAAVWMAWRKQNQPLQTIIRKQHWVVSALFLYAVLNVWVWPQWGHWALTIGWVGLMQKLLAVPVIGIMFGIIGILYILRLLARVIKFVRIGPRGLPPLPEKLR